MVSARVFADFNVEWQERMGYDGSPNVPKTGKIDGFQDSEAKRSFCGGIRPR